MHTAYICNWCCCRYFVEYCWRCRRNRHSRLAEHPPPSRPAIQTWKANLCTKIILTHGNNNSSRQTVDHANERIVSPPSWHRYFGSQVAKIACNASAAIITRKKYR